jgi:uncharacterized membrane protein YbhN (UPF0104 family)
MDGCARAFTKSTQTLSLKRLARLLGTAVVALSLIFIGRQLWTNAAEADAWNVGKEILFATGIGAVIYAGACLFLSSAWRRLLHLFGNIQVPALTAASVYAQSQIGKYVPGNIFHFAARHALGRDYGLAHSTLAMSAFGEISGLTAAASFLGLLAAIFSNIGEKFASIHWPLTGAIVAIGIVVLVFPHFWSMLRVRYPNLPALDNKQLRREITSAFVQYLLFFLVAGAVLVLLVAVSSQSISLHEATSVLLVFALSWIAGFITPGAPSGLGVREAIIVLALDRLGLAEQSLAIALLFRVSTVGGDILFLLVFLLRDRKEISR